ncbi:sigma-70 family RNA polymerase sigma factor [Salinibacillus xinjiangensis]|uniref:Sigma-70 family RNA polymerase sigma factor n=1 Tax=Salinibacillus xinjiangensis TaxID=1229268 RepID=A0A6G1X8V0_9BACI|nr:sigma-70 family RNA polymerase sigma factor [Salinibacillus xinjiangensis]MRG87394.1 sigma-70 family RNA polymerase sigma factor [Salinibacillus xinjiangensis]
MESYDTENNDLDIALWPRERAIEYVIDNYGETVKRIIFTYVKNYVATDDLFQDFLITVYRRLDSFQGESKLKTWLCRIAINKCKDHLKSPVNRIIYLREHIHDTGHSKSPEQLSIKDEERQQLINAIFSLSIKYREVLVLRYYQSLSIKEISELLHLNESTVKTRIARGKGKLRSKLGGVQFDEIES